MLLMNGVSADPLPLDTRNRPTAESAHARARQQAPRSGVPVLTGDPRTDRALFNIALILARIARNPRPAPERDASPQNPPAKPLPIGDATAPGQGDGPDAA